MPKLTEADKRYQNWLQERDAREAKEAEESKRTTIKVDNGDAFIVIRNFKHGEEVPTIEVAFEADKILNEAGLLAIGLVRCAQDEKWRHKLLLKTHDFVSEELRKQREEELT